MLKGDQRLADGALRMCYAFATVDEVAEDLGAVMETLVVCMLHLCSTRGGDPYEFMRDATQKYYETMVVDAEAN